MILDFIDKMNSFIDIELFSALNEHKCTRFREFKQGVDDHIHIRFCFFDILAILRFCKLDMIKLCRDGHKGMCSMISAHQNMPQISVNYFCVENNYFIVALCYFLV